MRVKGEMGLWLVRCWNVGFRLKRVGQRIPGDGLGRTRESIPVKFSGINILECGFDVVRTSPSKMSNRSISLSERPETRVPLTDRSSGDNSRPANNWRLWVYGITPG